MLYGQGAGQMPTASAVVSDVIYACHSDGRHRYMTFRNEERMSEEVNLVENFRCIYCIRVNVVDELGTMAAISEVFAKHNVSLKDVLQLASPDNGVSPRITFMTHEANEFDIRNALADIARLPCVHAIESMIRAEQ